MNDEGGMGNLILTSSLIVPRSSLDLMSGLFITLEGMDGCGKSTQLEMLARALEGRGLDFIVTREPGGTPLGEGVRDLLVSDEIAGVSRAAELFLIVGARAQHVAEVIKPALARGRIIISDRYTDSTVAFQGYGRGIDLSLIDQMNRFATDGLAPDLTIIFDLEPAAARARLRSRPVGGLLGALDEEALDFHARVREGYLSLAKTEPSRVRVVDSSGTPEQTHESVMSLVLSRIP